MGAHDPVSEMFLIEMTDRMEKRFDEGHGRVRESINDLRVDLYVAIQRLEKTEREMLVIQTEREQEARLSQTRRQDQRDRTVLLTAFTSMCITVIMFIAKTVWDTWRG